MSNGDKGISRHFTRLLGPRAVAAPHTLADFRAQYDRIAAGYGEAPRDMQVEHANLGQVKGEWLRVAETQPHRLVFYLHGGGYIAGSPESHRPLVARLCKSAASAALTLRYRLAPEFPFPAALRDVVDAYRFLIGKTYPPSAIVFAGDGSGGGLALAGLLAIRNAGLPLPAACVAMSPWADLSLSGWSMLNNAPTDNVLSWPLLFASARHYLQNSQAWDVFASPVFGTFRDMPPIMVHAGSLELLRDDASRIGGLAAAANRPISVEIYDGMQHVFQGNPTLSEAGVSLTRMGQFIRGKTPENAQALAT